MTKSKFTITNYFSGNIKECLRRPKYIINYSNMYISKIKMFFNKAFKGSYSQYGEDLILAKLLNNTEKGFYIDVGANDPVRLNNTKYFYDRGWTGINIEPDPTVYERLSDNRKKDININAGISNTEGELLFYKISPDTLSTFSKEAAIQSEKMGYKIEETIKLPVLSLKTVFEKYVCEKKVDFISIDAEGYDIEILKSNDWQIYRPKFVMIEINQAQEELTEFMIANKYKLVFKNDTNGIFIDSCDY